MFILKTEVGENQTPELVDKKDSDLLLFAIEKDIPIVKDEVTEIFQHMVPNRKIHMQTKPQRKWHQQKQVSETQVLKHSFINVEVPNKVIVIICK